MTLLDITLVVLAVLSYSTHAIQYEGTSNSWAKYSKWNLCPNKDAALYLTFKSDAADGLLAYMDDGKPSPTDYLLVQLKDGKVSLEYQFGEDLENMGPATFTRTDVDIPVGQVKSISIIRKRMALLLTLSTDPGTNSPEIPNFGGDLCFGDCLNGLEYTLSSQNSDLYIGGVPASVRNSRSSLNLPPAFSGEIYDVEYKNCECSRSNPKLVDVGQSIGREDPCFNRTEVGRVCGRVSQESSKSATCTCLESLRDASCSTYIEYSLDFDRQDGSYLVNNDGLDAYLFGSINFPAFPIKFLKLGGSSGIPTYAHFAGESQRDECLGNLQLCPDGYTLSFWMVILNSDLALADGQILIDNGGYDSHGITVYWKDNALHTRFRKPDGTTWTNTAYELYPAQVYYSPTNKFADYWYHFAASWTEQGLQVYINGELVGISNPSFKAVTDQRSPFVLGSTRGSANQMGISDIKFFARWMDKREIIGYYGPRHYFFSMNKAVGSELAVWPSYLRARINGDVQMVRGRSDMAIKLGSSPSGGAGSYIDAGDVNETCFGQVSVMSESGAVEMCDIYISFWVKFDDAYSRLTVLDTGRFGISILYRDSNLVVLIYSSAISGGVKPISLTVTNPQAGRWYFVEVDRNSRIGKNELWVNGQVRASATTAPFGRPRVEDIHDGISSNLLIGKRNPNRDDNFRSTGMFTIDQLDLHQGNRDNLMKIGHIQRGIPPHILYTMDGFWKETMYLNYKNQSIQHDPRAVLENTGLGYKFVPGKDMAALSLSGTTFEIQQLRRNEECYNNLEKCVHGLLVRGWFNLETLSQNTGFMSTGFNGINMGYQNGRLVITANTLSRRWQIDVNDISENKWMFLEISFHPKFGLSVYKDKERIAETINYSNINLQPVIPPSKFILGGSNDRNTVQSTMIVDDLEIWYGDRDYVCSFQIDKICGDGKRSDHYVIDFDEWDYEDRSKLEHEELTIPAVGILIDGVYKKALDVDGSRQQLAEISNVKQFRTLPRNHWIGNLSLVEGSGYTVSFYLYPEDSTLTDNGQAVYFLSTGTSGLDVYYKNGRLHAEARLGKRKWKVSSPQNYLVANNWNKIIVAWSPVKGLVLARDERLYLVAQDMFGTMSNESKLVDTSTNSRYLIGNANLGVGENNQRSSLQVAFDEMHIWHEYLPVTLGPIDHHSFSFERNHLSRDKVEHPIFDVKLFGAQITEGDVGNTSSLNGNGQYADLGDHSDIWIDDLDQCDLGLTLSFRVNPRKGFFQAGQVVLSGNSYEISTLERSRLSVKVMTENKEWEVKSFSIPSGEWTLIDVSWTEEGLDLFVNGTHSLEDKVGEFRDRATYGSRLLVGKANDHANRRYFNGEVDEIHFYRANYRELVKKLIFPDNRCNFHSLIVNMNSIRGNKVGHEYKKDIQVYGGAQVVEGLYENGIKLEDYQYIEMGSRLTCQSRPNSCINGFTLRFSIRPTVLSTGSYLISSNPVEIVYGNDRNLYVRYRAMVGIWQSMLSGLDTNMWYTIDLSWDDENGMTVYVNDVQRAWQQVTTSAYPDYDASAAFFINRDPTRDYPQSEFVVDDVAIWDAKRELLKSCGHLPPVKMAPKHNAIYPDNQRGYIRLFYIPTEYEVSEDMDEQLTIRFLATQRNGLLWYNADGLIKSYIYLEDGDLWFATQDGKNSVRKRRITTSQNLGDGRDHTLVMEGTSGNNLVFTIDGSRVRTVTTDHRVRFLIEDFNVGGHKNPSGVTGGEVTMSFVGTIKDVKFNHSSYVNEFDIFKEMWEPSFPDYVRVSCDMVFDPPIDAICDKGNLSVTFIENNTFIIEESWANKGKKPSIEIRFTTVEPRGLLLFTGSQYGQYFALEIFDGRLYMVTNVGNGPVRKEISEDVANNKPHTAKFIFNTDEGKINVFFDGGRLQDQDVSFNARIGLSTMFEGDIYLGGYKDYYMQPWGIWSKSGFVGCVEELQVNTLSSELRKLYATQNAKNIVDGCQPFENHCDSRPCMNGAECTNRKDRYHCDCSGMPYVNEICAKAALIGNINGTSYFDVSLGKDVKSHVNDFSVRFKTMTPDGTMFMTYSPSGTEYIKLFFEDGQLKVAVNVDGREVETTLPGQYVDYEWHSLQLKRRADYMIVWVDDSRPTTVDLTSKDFYIYMNTIRLGADIPNPQLPYFFGHFSSLTFPGSIDGVYPIIDPYEIPIIVNPITVLTTGAFIRVPNLEEEMVSDFKIILVLKTKQKNSLFMYQAGKNGQYLAGLIKDGRLQVRFNFGGDDKLIDTNKYVSDNRWHIMEIYRAESAKLSVKVDYSAPVEESISSYSLTFDHEGAMFIGGTPRNILLAPGLRQFYTYDMRGYRGCLASLVKGAGLIDMGDEYLQDPEIREAKVIIRGCHEQPVCQTTKCEHGCICSNLQSFCDNTMVPFYGLSCEQIDIGFRFNVDRIPGQVVFQYGPVETTTDDRISFGFKTCKPNGLFAKLSGKNDDEQIKIYLKDGKVVAEYKLGGPNVGKLVTTDTYHDTKLYIVQFARRGLKAELTIIDSKSGVVEERDATVLSGSDEKLDGLRLLEIGSEKNNGIYENVFDGVIVGFKHTKYYVFYLIESLTRGTYVKQPGTMMVRGDLADMELCESEPVICGPEKQTCRNFGVCENNRCNCTLTAYIGDICTVQPTGHYYGFNYFKPGLVIHEYPEAVTTYNDYLAVGLMTYEPDGTIFRVENSDGSQYYHLRLVNGKAQLEYRLKDIPMFITEDRITLHSFDDEYYVIRMNRTGENITFFVDQFQNHTIDLNIAGVPFRNQKELTSGGVMRQSNIIEEDWNGILGGLYYNGIFVYHLPFSSTTYKNYGDIKIVYDPYKLNIPVEFCHICHNGGKEIEGGLCDCMYTGFSSECCAGYDKLYGFQTKKYGGNGLVIYRNDTMIGRQIDELSVSFRTAKGWGDAEILRIESKDKTQYVVIEIVNDLLKVRHNLGGIEDEEEFRTVEIREQNNHHVRIYRNGTEGYIELKTGELKLDVISREVTFQNANIFDANIIYVGAKYNQSHISSGHYGILWNINFNGFDLVETTRSFTENNGISMVSEGGGNIEIIEHPWPRLCDKTSLNGDCSSTPPTPSTPGGNGGIIPLPVGPNPPGGILHPPPPALITPATGKLIGAIMGALIFTSAVAFAAAGMKPGFLALSKGMVSGGGGQGMYVPVNDGKLSAGTFPKGQGNYMSTIGLEVEGGGGGGGSQAGTRSLYEDSVNHETRFDATDASVAGGGAMNGVGGGGGGFNTYNSTNTWYARNETIENQNQAGFGGSTMGGYGGGRGGYAGSVAGGSVAGSVYGFGTVTNPDQAFITLSEDIAVDNVMLTADGRYVVTGSNLGPPQVWNTTNGEMVTTMRGDFMGSTGLHLAANEQYLVGETMAEQASVDMNDIQTGNHIPIRRVAVWDFNTGNPLPIAVDQLCTASCVSKDGFKVVMAMTDKFGGGTTVKVLDLLSNKVLHEITYPDTIGVADSASCVFISPDDRFVAVGFTNSFDNNANFIVFDLFNKAGVVDSPIVALNADPHCTVILNHDEALTGTKNGELVIWSMKTGKAQRQLTSGDATMLSQGGMPAAHDMQVKEVALSDDGKYLASASSDRTVKIWSMNTESLLHTLHGHNDEVWTVDIASDNSIVVSGSQDGTIKLWRLRNGNQITSFNATMDIFHARFSKDKKTVVALGDKYGARKLIMLQIVSQKKWRMKSS